MRYLVELPPVVSLPVVGSDARFPVRRVYCVGQNYAEHAKEMGGDGRQPPFFFTKPRDAVVTDLGEGGAVPYPPLTRDYHHEVELVVALGTGGRDVDAKDALGLVAGYAVGLDMTRRDLQREAKKDGRPWDMAKGFDASAPTSALRLVSDGNPPPHGEIRLSVNGAVRQRADLGTMIWSVAETLAALSRYVTLAPGDLVFTGTPAGVGAVVAGDVLDAHIDGVGDLRVTIAPAR